MKAPDKLIAKQFLGKLTDIEKKELQQWLSESEENASIVEQAQKVWDELGFADSEFTEDKQVAWEMMVSSIKPITTSEKRSLSKLIGQTLLIIVLLFIVMGIGIALLTGTINTTITAKQRSERVSLPDGTIAYLDSGTTIKYSKLYGSRNRTVNLKGEAIFEAISAQRLPLTIRTKNSKITIDNGIADVLTKDESIREAIALRGNLNLKTISKTISVREGSMISVDSLDTPMIIPANMNLIAWRTGQLVADGTPLGKLIRPIEKLTRKKVHFSSTVDYSIPLTFTVKPATERSITDTLAKHLKLQVKLEEQTIVFY